jgi:hypothetical protein
VSDLVSASLSRRRWHEDREVTTITKNTYVFVFVIVVVFVSLRDGCRDGVGR